MRLYFLRHAEALEGQDDDLRPLSKQGRKDADALGRFLDRAGVQFDAAYASPLLRAQQTAEIVLKRCAKKSLKLATAGALTNETSAGAFKRWLARLPKAKHVLLVGHAPSLSERLADLLGVKDASACALAKGAVASVETGDGRRGQLRLFLSPRHLA
jgi:phosphohistidine phosphatase